jgi:hypothetical protein
MKSLRRGFDGPLIINLTNAKLMRILTIRDSVSNGVPSQHIEARRYIGEEAKKWPD